MSASPTSRLLRCDDLAVFVGRLGDVGLHRHHAPALLVGLDGDFGLQTEAVHWPRCHGAWLPAGLSHRLDVRGTRLAVLYFDPVLRGALPALTVANTAQTPWLRIARDALQSLDAGAAPLQALRDTLLDDVLPRSGVCIARSDLRLTELARQLAADATADWSLPQAARRAGLSASRFSHRFAQHSGVSWTAYRNWTRLLDSCIALSVTPQPLTHVALDQGYSSAAHFAASFRDGLGLSPSQLRGLRPQIGAGAVADI